MKLIAPALAMICCLSSAVSIAAPLDTKIDISCYLKSSRDREPQPDWNAIAKDFASNRIRTNCRQANAKQFIPQPSSQKPLAVSPTKSPEPNPGSGPTSDFVWLVRKDLSDVGLFSLPTSNDKADGAELSWSRNNITRDNIWQIDGLVALAYSYLSNDYSPFIGVTVAPYLKVNRELHSAAAASDSNSDVVTAGGSAEIGFNMPTHGANYFRAHWSETEDHIAGSRISNAGGEWIPTYLRIHNQIPGTFIVYNFRPELKVDYDHESQGVMPLGFSGLSQSLRVGPEAKLIFQVTDFGGKLPDWAQSLASLKGSITYHWWTELYSGKSGSWLDASIAYNLDKDGNIALTFDYKKGRNEETAKRTDLYKVSLNFKTCNAFFGYSGGTCNGDAAE